MKWPNFKRKPAVDGEEPPEIYGYRPYLLAFSGAWVSFVLLVIEKRS